MTMEDHLTKSWTTGTIDTGIDFMLAVNNLMLLLFVCLFVFLLRTWSVAFCYARSLKNQSKDERRDANKALYREK